MSNDLAKFQSNAARTSKNIDKAFAGLGAGIKGAFGGITAALSIRELGQMADSFSNIQARLRLATRNATEFAEANENIKRIADSSKSPLESTATLYTRISQSLLDIGGTQAQVAATTQALALGLRLSGATAEESASAMLQFSQAIGSGVLRGEEFNAINEAAPRIMKALADSLGVPVGKLRELAQEGKITRDILVNSLGSQLPQLLKEAQTLPDTIGASWQKLRNELLLTVGDLDKFTGASSKAANLLSSAGSGALKTITLFAANAAFTFGQVSREILGVGERLIALGKGDFHGFDAIGQRIKRETAAARAELKELQDEMFKTADKAVQSAEFTPLATRNTGPTAEQIAATKAAAKAAQSALESLRKEGAQLAASVDPIVNRNQELAKYVELLNKGAISQDIFDRAATKSITTAQAALDATDQRLIAAKQAQEALDALTKEGENLKLAVDPFYKLNKEIERYSELLNAGVIDQQTFDLAVEKSMGKNAEVVQESADKMNAAMIGFQTNVQNTLGQGIYNSMTGSFDNIFSAWKDLLFRMISAGLAAHVSESIFGANGKSGLLKGGLDILGSILGGFGSMGKSPGGTKLGSSNFGQFLWPVPKFATGGDFSGGLRLVGERGPELEATGPSRIFNANQTKDILNGGKKGVSVNYAPVIQIDSRADRTEVHAIVTRAVKQGNADLVDRLTRQGVI
jgi:tape measure domain-containing protein